MTEMLWVLFLSIGVSMNFENKQELYKVSESTKKMQVWKGWTEGTEDEGCYSYGGRS